MINAPGDPLIGSTISQYAIVAKLGGGGMGVVYKATDTKLGRTVALKFLPPQWSHDEGAKQRFLREAQAASATNHRNICVIHDIEQTDDGRLFIVMAYYDGQTLKQKLEGGALPIGEALEIGCEVAEGLAKAHSQGVVHRDVKPGNLIITDDGVKIVDFGLAKFADALQLTIPGSTVGTVAYMSPEQARGEEADTRSDVWALGVVMFEMLSGEVPFKGAYPEAIFHAIKNQPLPPLNAPGRLIPEPIEALVLRALEKDPAKRYQSAREMARDLRLVLGRSVPLDLVTGPLPLIAPRPAPAPPSWRHRVARAPTPTRVAAAVLLLAAIGYGSYRWITRPVMRILVAIAPIANHTGEPELDSYRLALTETLMEELAESPNMRVVPFARVMEIVGQYKAAGEEAGREAIQTLASQSGARFVVMPALEYRNNAWLVRAEVRNTESGTVTKAYETDAVTSSLPKEAVYRLMPSLADRIQEDFKTIGAGRAYRRRAASSRLRNLDAARAFADGLAAYEQMEYSAALAAFRRAISQDGQHALAHVWSSRVLLTMRQGKEAVESARRAKQVLPAGGVPLATSTLVDAVLAESEADKETAESRYRERAAIQADDAASQLDLADFLARQQQYQPAIAAYREALRRDPTYVRPHLELSQLYRRTDEYPLGEHEANEALAKYRALRNRSGEAHTLLAVSELQRRRGQLAEARRTGEEAREIFESLGLSYGLSQAFQYLGIVVGYSGNYRLAVQYFEESLTRSRRVGNRLVEGLSLNNLGVAHERLGQRVKALEYYQQSRDVYQDSGEVASAAEQEANAAALLIDYGSNQEEALKRLANARATFRKLGNIEFDVIATEFEAASALHAGRHEDARRQLRAASNVAKDRGYLNRVVSTTVRLAESYFATSEYEEGRKGLDQVGATEAGRVDPEVSVWLGRLYMRLGDFAASRASLERALAQIQENGQLSLLPAADLAMGELELESGHQNQAKAMFAKAGSLWVDDLPDASSVEARCNLGLIQANEGVPGSAFAMVASAVEQAAKMRRLYTEGQCRLQLARIQFARHQYTQALSVLDPIPGGTDVTIGREMEGRFRYWRSHALLADGKATAAEAEAGQAVKLMTELEASLPSHRRMPFAARADIRQVLQSKPVGGNQ